MNTEFILSYVLLYAATIALICAVYVFLISRKNKKIIPMPVEEVEEQEEILD